MASLNPDAVKLMTALLTDRTNFPEVHKALPAVAIKLAVDEIKARPTNIAMFEAFKTALGSSDFILLLDAVSKPTLAKAVKGLDADNPALRGAEEGWLRKRLVALLDGEPAFVKPARTIKSAAPRKPPKSATGKSPAVKKRETNPTKAKNSKAVWDGKNRDDEA